MRTRSTYLLGSVSAPNAFGIDYQQTASLICLREGIRRDALLRSVGDGQRGLIPHVVGTGETWGSHAMQSPGGGGCALPTAAFEDGPWLHGEHAPVFWQRLYKRLYDYIGQINPTTDCGYQTVVSVQGRDMEPAQERVQELCAQAGLGDVTCIAATDAVLCRWLLEAGAAVGASRRNAALVVVAVGDVSVLVSAYQAQWDGGAFPAKVTRGTTLVSLPTGQAWWIAALLEQVRNVVSEMPATGYELALRDAAIEFGTRLGRASFRQKVAWVGPFRDRMFQPLQLAGDDCAQWPSAALLRDQLPQAVRQALGSVGAKAPDVVIVGGMGAAWPFVRQTLEGMPVWQSRTPQEDAAQGAAWWPYLEAMHPLEQVADVQDTGQAFSGFTSTGFTSTAVPSGLPAASEEPSDLALLALLENGVFEREAVVALSDSLALAASQPGLEQTHQEEAVPKTVSGATGSTRSEASTGFDFGPLEVRQNDLVPGMDLPRIDLSAGKSAAESAPAAAASEGDAGLAWLLRTGGQTDKEGSTERTPSPDTEPEEARPPWMSPFGE